MPRMQKDRLKLLIERLRKHQDNGRRFDMGKWYDLAGSDDVGDDDEDDSDDRIYIAKRVVDPYTGRVREERTCGTSACALGEACVIPAFRKLGLTLIPSPHDALSFTPVYKRKRGLDAGRAFFGLTEHQATYIFMPDEYTESTSKIHPMDVVEHIEAVLNGYDPR
ncbi:MAG TPA: hypothetical protein VMX14_09915 [Anaerolineae bacterium]|nr:hypothetical protein [Anaerolineae bacterium]